MIPAPFRGLKGPRSGPVQAALSGSQSKAPGFAGGLLLRTLVTHDLMAILELIAFVVARKMLKPDLTSLDILVGAAAFALLLLVRRYLFPAPVSLPKAEGPAGSD